MFKIQLLTLIILPLTLWSQGLEVSGFVRDATTNEYLTGATITNQSGSVIGVSNDYGYFSLKIKNSNRGELKFSYIGFAPFTIEINESKEVIEVLLRPSTTMLGEVKITPLQSEESYLKLKLDVKELARVPVIFGEPDIIKSLTTFAGIQNGKEGTSGLIVRGGGYDQNLIILDEAPIYNLNHLFGFVSSFNPDAIKDVTIYKSAFPAEYGGRLSSVVDIKMKEGSNESLKGNLSLGLLSSRFEIEGPLVKKTKVKSSFLFAARSSYLGLFLLPMQIGFMQGNRETYSNYWFADINAKVNSKFGKRGQLMFSYFQSFDNFKGQIQDEGSRIVNDIRWKNNTAALRYVHSIGSKVFSKTIVTQSRYTSLFGISERFNGSENTIEGLQFAANSKLSEVSLKQGFEYFPNNSFQVNLGVELKNISFTPSRISSNLEYAEGFLEKINVNMATKNLIGYAELQKKVGKLRTTFGYRITKATNGNISLLGHEPRVSLSYIPTQKTAISASFNYGDQFIHLLNGNTSGLSNDIWIPFDNIIKPQNVFQYDIEVSQRFSENLKGVVGLYYKSYSNLVDYNQRSSFLTNFSRPYKENIVSNGIGFSKGLEFLLKYEYTKLKGWTSFTLSRNRTKFEDINNGDWFNSNFDRPISISSVFLYDFNTTQSIAANFTLQSGDPVTLPIALFKGLDSDFGFGRSRYLASDRNAYRLPIFHKLDVSYTIESMRRKGNSWTFGVYNIYARRNPFYIKDQQTIEFRDPMNNDFSAIGMNTELLGINLFSFLPYISFSRKLFNSK